MKDTATESAQWPKMVLANMTGCQLGFLMNFKVEKLRDGVRRVVLTR